MRLIPRAKICNFSSIYGQIVGQSELFNLEMVTGLGDGELKIQTR